MSEQSIEPSTLQIVWLWVLFFQLVALSAILIFEGRKTIRRYPNQLKLIEQIRELFVSPAARKRFFGVQLIFFSTFYGISLLNELHGMPIAKIMKPILSGVITILIWIVIMFSYKPNIMLT